MHVLFSIVIVFATWPEPAADSWRPRCRPARQQPGALRRAAASGVASGREALFQGGARQLTGS